RLEFGRRLIPFGFVVDLEFVAIRIPELECLAVAEVAVAPADIETRSLQCRCAPLQRLRRSRPECRMSEAGRLCCRKLERILLILVPAAQKDAVAFFTTLRHAHDVDEKPAAFLEFGREEFNMCKVGDVVDRFGCHGFRSSVPSINCAEACG